MSSKPKVSVVVLNWNGRRFVDPFMKSFEGLLYPANKLELLFIDNDSTDDSVAYFKRRYGTQPNVRIIQNDKNYGYSEGNNLGIHQASGEYILVCNNDLELDPSLLKEMTVVAVQKKAAAVVPLLMFSNNPDVINNAGSRLDTNSSWPIYEIGINEKNNGQYNDIREITAFCGACVMFSREFLQTVGLFDKRFFMYFEDGDLSWRGQQVGCKYFIAPKAIAYHFHAGTSKEGSVLFNHFVGRNRVLVLAKNARIKVFLRGLARTLRDHLYQRIKNVVAASGGKYGKRKALDEFLQSQKLIVAIVVMLPYAFCKRFGVLKEDKL